MYSLIVGIYGTVSPASQLIILRLPRGTPATLNQQLQLDPEYNSTLIYPGLEAK
jgi:hypothetical protein